MLTLEDEELAEELRRELVVLLHLSRDRMPALRRVREWREAFAPLREVRSRFEGVNVEQAALRIAAPPFLRRDRLRGILSGCLQRLLGEPVPFSIRILSELGETLQAAFDLEEVWLEQGAAPGRTVLCFTDEEAVGSLPLLLSELKGKLEKRRTEGVVEVFPLNHYDILFLGAGPMEKRLSSTEEFVAKVYGELTGGPVSATSRPLGEAPGLLEFLGS